MKLITERNKKSFERLAGDLKQLPLRHQAYILATVYHETAGTFEPIEERGSKGYFNRYIGKLGNDGAIGGDCYTYRGRGFVQITGRGNYARFGIVNNPALACHYDVALDILIRGMCEGIFTGKKLGDYVSYQMMRRVVNGIDCAQKIAQYAERFEEYLTDHE
jgi:hypothetical protein